MQKRCSQDGQRMYSLSTVLSGTYNSTKKDGGIKAFGWFGTPPSPGRLDCNEKPVQKTHKCWFEEDAQRTAEDAWVGQRSTISDIS